MLFRSPLPQGRSDRRGFLAARLAREAEFRLRSQDENNIVRISLVVAVRGIMVRVNVVGAQTERPGVAQAGEALLGGEDLTGRLSLPSQMQLLHVRLLVGGGLACGPRQGVGHVGPDLLPRLSLGFGQRR